MIVVGVGTTTILTERLSEKYIGCSRLLYILSKPTIIYSLTLLPKNDA